MRLKTLCSVALGALMLSAAPAATADTVNRIDVEHIVHDYLLAHPEILNEMLAELQAKDAADADKKAKDAISSDSNSLVNDGYSYVAGNPNGDVTVVEFFDYRCTYCKKMRPEVVNILAKDKNVRLVLKEFPILSKVSEEASKAAMASIKQGGDLYWKFNQAMLAANDLDSAAIYEIAGEQGLDVTRLKKDMTDPAIADNLKKNHDLAEKIGIDATPSFVVGDKLEAGAMSEDELQKLINEKRKGG